jgi:hypothetical protein
MSNFKTVNKKRKKNSKNYFRIKISLIIILVLIIISIIGLVVHYYNNSQTIAAHAITKSSTTLTISLNCPTEWDLVKSSGSCFKIFDVFEKNFIQALSYCLEVEPKSYLGEIITDDEFDYVNRTVKEDTWV